MHTTPARPRPRPGLAGAVPALLLALAACATPHEPIEVPHFAADDPRVGQWEVGYGAFELGFPEEPVHEEPPVTIRMKPPGTAGLRGERASFRGTRWINVDLDAEAWLPGGEGKVLLRYVPSDGGDVVTLPPFKAAYAVAFVEG